MTQKLVKYGLWGFMKSNLTKSVVVLAGFALLYVLTRIPLAHVGERVVSCDSYAAALFDSPFRKSRATLGVYIFLRLISH